MTPKEDAVPVPATPWLSSEPAGRYIERSKRFILREAKAGRLRHTRIGGRGEILTRREWLDEYVEQHMAPVVVSTPRRLRGVS